MLCQEKKEKNMKFKTMDLAFKYCKGKGIEIGAAAHNPFGLDNCINISPKEEEDFYKQSQIAICGEFTKIDKYGYADKLPVDDSSYDYIITSHVIEHVPDLIRTFQEWTRVLKHNGIVFMIFPHRCALASDKGRPLSQIWDVISAHNSDRDHYCPGSTKHEWVFSLKSMCDIIEFCNTEEYINWEIIDTEETDSKVGNGHTVVCRIIKNWQ